MSQSNKHEQQTIALAAIFQAASLVEQLARTGDIPAAELELLITSLFKQSPDSFDDIYGSKPNLQAGFHGICKMMGDDSLKSKQDIKPEVMRYALSIVHLEGRLRKNSHMMNQLGESIQSSVRQADHFHITHESVIGSLADTYKQTLSTLSFRIKVSGNPQILQNSLNANKVRALLLAGIRAAILWRQVGGRRWHLLFNRKRYIKDAQSLLIR
jgi:high frequency lysogenization protein|tara:strand:- start:1002 stop:1640 length:639 start_codon:yes stop_codon:yes gene_type:complete